MRMKEESLSFAACWRHLDGQRITDFCTTGRWGRLQSRHVRQRMQHRDEVWTVIAGEGKTVVDGMEQNVKAGDVITMSAGCRHTIIAETELKLIEVQLGEAIDVHDKQKFELEY